MSASAFRRLILASLVLALLVLIVCASARRTFDPHGADFAAFYSGAVLWQQGQNAFDRQAACEAQSRSGISFCMLNFHPPVLLPLLSAVVNGDYVASYL